MDDSYIKKCSNCGKEYCIINTTFKFEEKTYCLDCIKDALSMTGKPYFIQHIPNFVDGATAKCFVFDTIEELCEKVSQGKPSTRSIYTYDGNSLMVQSIDKSFWWVIGSVIGFDLSSSGLPKSNYDIYDTDGNPIAEKISTWLDGKKIICE